MLKRIFLPAMSVAVLFAVCAAAPAHAYDTHTKINFVNQSSNSKVRFIWGKDGHPRGVDQEVKPGGKMSIDEKAPALVSGEKTYGYYLQIESPDGKPICRVKYDVTNLFLIGPTIMDCKARLVSGQKNCMLDEPKLWPNNWTCSSNLIYIDGLEK